MTKIGEAKEELASAIETEFGAFADQLDGLSRTASILAAESAGINGASTFWRGVKQQLDTMTGAVRDRQTETLATLAGKPKHEVVQSVDAKQTEKVLAAKGAA